MVSTPAVMASAMPCPPCACAATGSPRECALCTAATSSAAVYCDSCGPSDGVKFPPVTMILIWSTPRAACSRTASRIPS